MAEVRPIKFAPLVRDDAEAQAAFAEAVDAANIALFDAAVAAADAAGVNLVTVRDEAFLTYIRDNAAALGFDQVDRECYLEDADTVCAQSTSLLLAHPKVGCAHSLRTTCVSTGRCTSSG